MTRRADILLVTHQSAGYLNLSLPRLLETCGEQDRVWLWHNGEDEETLEMVHGYARDPRVERFHHSRENVRLHPPISWLLAESKAKFVSKVDDDCRVTPGWIDTFAEAHEANPEFGAVASWRHLDEDFVPELAMQKIITYAGGHQLLRNAWVQGSGFLLSRRWVDRCGNLKPKESFNGYCVRIARAGALNGWYFPFVFEDHMDDPRSPHTLMTDDEAFRVRSPLSAQLRGVTTVAGWEAQLRNSAVVLQSADPDPRMHSGWRAKSRNIAARVTKLRRILPI